MSKSLVLTIIGEDRPGLVDALSNAVTRHEGNWLEGRMSSLAGKFAGILQVSVPAAQEAALTQALQGLASQGLRIVIESSTSQQSLGTGERPLTLELVGQDHPGIVHDISHALASHHINIDKLSTWCSSASWSGETLFHAIIQLSLPEGVVIDELRDTLENLANELMVDITLDDAVLDDSAPSAPTT